MQKSEIEKLFNMKIGERLKPNDDFYYDRVPGGWTYATNEGMVFIPLCNESIEMN